MSLNELRAELLIDLEMTTDQLKGKDVDLELLRVSKQHMQQALNRRTPTVQSSNHAGRKPATAPRKVRKKTVSKSTRRGKSQPPAFLTSLSLPFPTSLSAKQRRLFSLIHANNPRALHAFSHLLSPSDLNLPDSKGLSPLFYAAESGLGVTRELVRLGASVDGKGKKSPLCAALVAGKEDVVDFLVRHGADVTRRNLSNCDPPSLLSQRLGLHPEAPNPFKSPVQLLRRLHYSSTTVLPAPLPKPQPRSISFLTLPKWVRKGQVELDLKHSGPLYPNSNKSGIAFLGEPYPCNRVTS